jgi:flagellar hook-associated protein 2
VNDFNTVSNTISQDDAYDPTSGQGGVLHADSTVEQIHNTLFNLLGNVAGAASDKTRSLLQMGITLNNGQLSLNSSALQAAIAADPSGVQDFLGNASSGMATQLNTALQNFTAPATGVIAQSTNALSQQITDQQSQITFLNAQIASKTTLLQNEFANMESNLAAIQSQSGVLTQLSNLATFNSYYANGSSTPPSSSSH